MDHFETAERFLTRRKIHSQRTRFRVGHHLGTLFLGILSIPGQERP
jgi:hypothetical protein